MRGVALEPARAKPGLGHEVGQEPERLERGHRRVDDVVGSGIELANQVAEHGGLAAARLGGEQGDRVAVEREAEALEGILEAGMGEKRRPVDCRRPAGTVDGGA